MLQLSVLLPDILFFSCYLFSSSILFCYYKLDIVLLLLGTLIFICPHVYQFFPVHFFQYLIFPSRIIFFLCEDNPLENSSALVVNALFCIKMFLFYELKS